MSCRRVSSAGAGLKNSRLPTTSPSVMGLKFLLAIALTPRDWQAGAAPTDLLLRFQASMSFE